MIISDSIKEFEFQNQQDIQEMGRDLALKNQSLQWLAKSSEYRYSYHFSWMGVPIIQFPQDIIAIQELIWAITPDLIIETGVARGGSVIFYASMLELLGGSGGVVGVDIDIRSHNRAVIEQHPMAKRITLIEGSSVDKDVVDQVGSITKNCTKVLVILDSSHTHDHVLEELNLYSSFVTPGSYLVVLDTIVEDLPEDFFPDRPWGKGNNPKTAVAEFLKTNSRFVVDQDIENKLLITVAPGGYLRCIA